MLTCNAKQREPTVHNMRHALVTTISPVPQRDRNHSCLIGLSLPLSLTLSLNLSYSIPHALILSRSLSLSLSHCRFLRPTAHPIFLPLQANTCTINRWLHERCKPIQQCVIARTSCNSKTSLRCERPIRQTPPKTWNSQTTQTNF